ncbi:hypothetical protein CB1_001108093 [Camelus ferus]|nr:hypothetical protein CB1_001108093 [Camelus ferus]
MEDEEGSHPWQLQLLLSPAQAASEMIGKDQFTFSLCASSLQKPLQFPNLSPARMMLKLGPRSSQETEEISFMEDVALDMLWAWAAIWGLIASRRRGVKPSFSLEAEKETIFAALDLLGEGERRPGEVKESFDAVVGWATCVVEEEQEKENVAFWRVVGRDFSVYHERSLSGVFKVMEWHRGKGNVSAACLPHHASPSLMVTRNEMKRKTSCSQTRMLMNVAFVSLEISSFYALVEEAFVLVEFFFEEMAAFLGLASF